MDSRRAIQLMVEFYVAILAANSEGEVFATC